VNPRDKRFQDRLSLGKSTLFLGVKMEAITSGVPKTTTTTSRKISLAAGVLYLLTFVSIPIGFLYYAVLNDPNYIVGPGPDTPVIIGGILEIIVALAGIGTAVVLYPVLKRQNEGIALGFIGSRVLEASTIFADVVCLMAIVTLRRAGVGTEALVTGKALVALYGLFRLGQNLMPAVNDLLLGSLLYQSRLVPRILPLLGIIGAPLLIANTIVFMFGITSGPLFVLTGIGVIPIAIFEFSLGVWLTFKGFNSSAITSLFAKPATSELVSAA
jgi:hypothetical protein